MSRPVGGGAHARLTPSSPTPLYIQLQKQLMARVQSGEWAPGTRIPTEADLCTAYEVSRVTVRQAVGRLVAQGVLTRERAKGTFVREDRMHANARNPSSFSSELGTLGMKPGARLIDVCRVPATLELAAALDIDEGTELVQIRRIRTGDGRPIALQTSHLVGALVPGIEVKLHDDCSLYGLLNQNYGIAPAEAQETFRVAAAPKSAAEMLEIRPGSPVFSVIRVTYDGRRPFENTTSIIRGDRYEIRLALRQS